MASVSAARADCLCLWTVANLVLSADVDHRRAAFNYHSISFEGLAMNPDPNHRRPEDDHVVQAFGSLSPVRLGLADDVRFKSVAALNRLLAHTLALRDLYKKSHWQTSGTTFYELHLLFDKHYGEQAQLADVLAERVQTLGGVARALAHDVTQETRLARAPSGIETAGDQLGRLLDAHELILAEARPLSREATAAGDEGTADVMVSQVVRTNELQSWFAGRHLAAAAR